jgi:hypothetical protein
MSTLTTTTPVAKGGVFGFLKVLLDSLIESRCLSAAIRTRQRISRMSDDRLRRLGLEPEQIDALRQTGRLPSWN